MKKVSCVILVIAAVLCFLNTAAVQAQTAVVDWGVSPGRWGGWHFEPGAAPGGATVIGANPPTGWATLRGQFTTITPSPGNAVVVTGKVEFVGGGFNAWSTLRWGLYYSETAGTLITTPVDSTRWGGVEGNHYGYLFLPASGNNAALVDWQGIHQQGSWGAIVNRPWISTNGGNDYVIGRDVQKPARAIGDAGVYDFAVSVEPLGDGTQEVRFYIIQDDNSYYFAGSAIDNHVPLTTDKFNCVCFGINSYTGSTTTAMKFTDVMVSQGASIELPEAPWSEYYVDMWGVSPGRFGGWLFTPGEFTGNATVGGVNPPTGWATLRGQFVEPVTPTVEKAVIVTGKVEFVGGGFNAWSTLRWGLYYSETAGNLITTPVDSTRWGGVEGNHYGYLFLPPSGNNAVLVDWQGVHQQGSWGAIVNRPWISTNGGNDYVIGIDAQKPARAVGGAGVYNFAVSVKPVGDGTQEVRFYIIKDDNSYYFAGSAIDTHVPLTTTKFNSICFGINAYSGSTTTSMKLMDVQVDMGDQIELPEAPWSAYYVDMWGVSPGRFGGWLFTPGEYTGNATVGGVNPPTGWATLRGQFVEPVTPTVEKAVIVTGKVEFVGGGFNAWSTLRWGLYYSETAGNLITTPVDSTRWGGVEGNHYGYLFLPPSGNNAVLVDWQGVHQQGSWGAIVNRPWISTNGGNDYVIGIDAQKPARAVGGAGVYNFAVSVKPVGDGTQEVRFYIIKDDNSYYFAGSAIDTHVPLTTTKFNSICFGINAYSGSTTTSMKLMDVQVDMGDQIELPEAPWSAYYVDMWGVSPGRFGGWLFTPGEYTGNATVGGVNPPTGWATLRGQFVEPVTPTVEKAVIVTGKVEFVGGGFNAWSTLRWGLYYSETAGNLITTPVDSTRWGGVEGNHYGYLFLPPSGNNAVLVDWQGVHQQGSWGAIVNRPWISTNGGNDYVIGIDAQKPARAVGGAGVYNFAVSVKPVGDGTQEVRFYIIKDDNSYYFAGSAIDTHVPLTTTKFNSICFGINAYSGSTTTSMKLMDVQVDMGDQIELPEPPWNAYYADMWGFIGGRRGGWNFVPGEYTGNAGVAGTDPLTGWSALKGGFVDPVKPTTEKAMVVTGVLELQGGGFEDWSSLRIGTFYTGTPGSVQNANTDSARWSGSEEHHSGYLFLPPSGSNLLTQWQGTGEMGTGGAVVDEVWLNTNGPDNYVITSTVQRPAGAAGSAGLYDFGLSVGPTDDGTTDVRFMLVKQDQSYSYAAHVIDSHDPLAAEKFNCINFAIKNGTTSGLYVKDVLIDYGNPLTLPDWMTDVEIAEEQEIPVEYALGQNYPNPFNPTTTISFALPKDGEISLVVYDGLGKPVATVAKGYYNAGYHKVVFDAEKLASGIYFYKLVAGDVVSVKKLVLMK